MAQAPEGKSDRVYQCHPGDAVSKGAEVSGFLSCGRQQAISCRKTAQGSSSVYQGEGQDQSPSLFLWVMLVRPLQSLVKSPLAVWKRGWVACDTEPLALVWGAHSLGMSYLFQSVDHHSFSPSHLVFYQILFDECQGLLHRFPRGLWWHFCVVPHPPRGKGRTVPIGTAIGALGKWLLVWFCVNP